MTRSACCSIHAVRGGRTYRGTYLSTRVYKCKAVVSPIVRLPKVALWLQLHMFFYLLQIGIRLKLIAQFVGKLIIILNNYDRKKGIAETIVGTFNGHVVS